MRLSFLLFAALPLCAQTVAPRDIFRELIEINTTDSAGDNTRAARAMAAHFLSAGFPAADVQVLEPLPRKGNLVVRFRGKGNARPILFIGHLDVVEALRSDWSFDPFQFREQDGYYYGRGTQDMKGDDAAIISAFLRLRREGWVPSRDLILALTADEENGDGNGVLWLVRNRRDLIDAAFCVNLDGGGGAIRNGRREYLAIQAAEKTYLSFHLEVTNPGGHSSIPTRENAIYRLAEGLTRLSHHQFPLHWNDVTRAYFERMASITEGPQAADMKALAQNGSDTAAAERLSASPIFNSMLHTTCVATMVSAGHAENALPQSAKATVNCRILPADDPQEIQRTLERVLADPKISLKPDRQAEVSPASMPDAATLRTVEAVAGELWPKIPVLLEMGTGATDGRFLRLAGMKTYGISGTFLDQDDIRAHGRDERVPVESFDQSVDFMYRLAKRLGTAQ